MADCPAEAGTGVATTHRAGVELHQSVLSVMRAWTFQESPEAKAARRLHFATADRNALFAACKVVDLQVSRSSSTSLARAAYLANFGAAVNLD